MAARSGAARPGADGQNGAMTDAPVIGRSPMALVVGGAVLVAAASGLGVWILVRGNDPFVIDAWWDTVLGDAPGMLPTAFAHTMNWLGGGWFALVGLPILVCAALLLLRRPWGAACFVVAEIMSAGAVQVLKQVFGRERPEGILVLSDYGSYPSGHVANATTIVVVAFALFPRLAVAIVGAAWVLLMALSRTQLHAHWLSDTLGGVLIGTGAALLVVAAFSVPLRREEHRHRHPARR